MEQIRQRIFGAIHCTPKVYIHEGFYHRQIQVLEHRTHGNTGIVHQYIDPAEFLHRFVDQHLAIFLADVCLDAEDIVRIITHGRHFRLQFVQVSGSHDDLRATVSE